MRMYTMHFGHGMEHTQMFYDQAKGNMPYNFSGWGNGTGDVPAAECANSQIVSHREIFARYGVKGGHGEYCLETWTHDTDNPEYACRLHTGGYGDTAAYGHDVRAFYLKFDFMYTQASGGSVVVLQRTKTGIGDNDSEDIKLNILNGYLNVIGSKHLTQPDTDPPSYIPTAWIPRADGRQGDIYLAPNKWHEIQIFVNPYQGWDVSEVGPDATGLGYYEVNPFVPFFTAYEAEPNNPPRIAGSETDSGTEYALQMDEWPSNGHPKFPNAMLPGHDQSAWPPENYASGQYFYGENLGLIYVWVNGKLDIQHTTNISNEQTGWASAYSQQSVFLGYEITSAGSASGGRFFYDNIIMNDIRDPSGSYPSRIFDPLFSSDTSLEWNPGYGLHFTAMEIDPDYWEVDHYGVPGGRQHNTWMPTYPLGALVPSGEPYLVAAPNRFGSPTDSMIPHGTKLTVVHVDWNGEEQDYVATTGSRSSYPDYDVDYAYQLVQPGESNPFAVSSNDPRLISEVSGSKTLFYLQRPAATSGKQPLAGGYGMGGIQNYAPDINQDMGQTSLPAIYRIWTCIQDHSIGTADPVDIQHHLIRVPSGTSGYVDYTSDNQCPGDRGYRGYHDGSASVSNGYSMADWPYNPVTGNPWTWEDLEALQIGAIHSSQTGGNQVEIYTLYLVVEHASVVDPEVDIVGTNLLQQATADDIPFSMQRKAMYRPGWKSYDASSDYRYYNRWDISPTFVVNRSDRQTTDGQSTVDTPQYSGVIEWDYYIRYINGEIAQGSQYRKFDEHFDEVWVYTVSGINPSSIFRHPMRGEVVTDGDGNHFTFLTYPVLQWNTKRYPTDSNLSPIDVFPYVVYDYNTMYIVPLDLPNVATTGDAASMITNWTDPNTKPSISGGQWTINRPENVFNYSVDPNSYFHPFSPSSVTNHVLTHPDASVDYTFPASRSGHDYYFQAPDLPSGSVSQMIYLTDRLGISDVAIDNELYDAYIGLYQTTASQATNDTGEGRFDFYSGEPGASTFISGYTFGQDGTAGWHLNSATVTIPSGTRQVKFTFTAIRNTSGPKSPGGTLGGTSNFAAFDEAFFVLQMSSNNSSRSYHPADTNTDNRIASNELMDYIAVWQSGTLPLGHGKDYLTSAEHIWNSGVSAYHGDPSGGTYSDTGGPRPDRWQGSGVI